MCSPGAKEAQTSPRLQMSPKHMETQSTPAVSGMTLLSQTAPENRDFSELPEHALMVGGKTSLSTRDSALCPSPGQGPQGARMLPRQEGVKNPFAWPNSFTLGKSKTPVLVSLWHPLRVWGSPFIPLQKPEPVHVSAGCWGRGSSRGQAPLGLRSLARAVGSNPGTQRIFQRDVVSRAPPHWQDSPPLYRAAGRQEDSGCPGWCCTGSRLSNSPSAPQTRHL